VTPAELLSQNTIFYAKMGDEPQLTLIHPAGDSDHHEPEWIQHSRHVGLLSQPPVKNPNKSSGFSIRTIRGMAPAPKRSQTTTWKDHSGAHGNPCCTDFFTVEVLTWRGVAT
jgi:hypothetical protein